MNSDHSSVASPNRRLIVAGLGAGVCAAAVGILRWPTAAPVDALATPSPSTTAKAGPESISTKSIETPSVASTSGQFGRDTFLPHLDTRFEITAEGLGSSSTKLVKISEKDTLRNGDVSYEGFSLLFDGPLNTPADGAIYRLRHAQLGEMELFLSPVGSTKDRTIFEAAFTLRA